MPWGAAVAGAASLAGGIISGNEQSNAAKSAAAAQEQSAQEQLQLQSSIYNATGEMSLPARESGGLAQSQLDYLMGLTPDLDISQDFAAPNIQMNNGNPSLTWQGPSTGYAATGTGAGNPSAPTMAGITGPNGGPPGSPTAASGAGGGVSFGGGTYGTNPAGSTLGYGGLMNPYNPATFYEDPGYNFDVQQNQLAENRTAAASGQLGTGAELTAAMGYAQNAASQEFNSAFSRSQSTDSQIYNMLTGVIGTGTGATNNMMTAGSNFASTGSNALSQYGNAASAGIMGAANATSGAINGVASSIGSLGSMYSMSQMNGQNSPYSSQNQYQNGQIPQYTSGTGTMYNNYGQQVDGLGNVVS